MGRAQSVIASGSTLLEAGPQVKRTVGKNAAEARLKGPRCAPWQACKGPLWMQCYRCAHLPAAGKG